MEKFNVLDIQSLNHYAKKCYTSLANWILFLTLMPYNTVYKLMDMYNSKSLFDGLICGGASIRWTYARGNNKICNLSLGISTITVM